MLLSFCANISTQQVSDDESNPQAISLPLNSDMLANQFFQRKCRSPVEEKKIVVGGKDSSSDESSSSSSEEKLKTADARKSEDSDKKFRATGYADHLHHILNRKKNVDNKKKRKLLNIFITREKN